MNRELQKVNRILVLIVFTLFEVTISLTGQNFTIKTFTTTEGLPHNNIRALARDSTGFLWIGTWDGLSRFDGHEFKNYYHVPNDSSSLPFFSVYSFAIDRNNDLWIHTYLGQVVKYNRNTDNFSILENVAGNSLEHIIDLYADDDGILTLLKESEIIRWDDRTKESSVFKLVERTGKPYIQKDKPFTATIINNNELWIAGKQTALKFIKTGVDLYSIKSVFPIIRPNSKKIFFDIHEWNRMYCSQTGGKWIFSNTGLFKLDETLGEFREYKAPIQQGEFTGKKHYYWGTYNEGIYLLNTSNSVVSHIQSKITRLPGEIFIDRDNSLWFSNFTYTGVAEGLTHLMYSSDFFKNNIINDSDSTKPAVYSVIVDKYGDIWVGIRGYDHILKLDNYNNLKTLDKIPDELLGQAGHIRAMIPVKDGIWIGYYLMLLQYYEYSTAKFANYFPGTNGCRTIDTDKEGNLYIGTTDLSRFDLSTGKTETLWKSNSPYWIYCLYHAPDGILWGGMSWSKILKYNTITKETSIINLNSDKSNVQDIIPGDNGELWIALLGEGVCRYNSGTGISKYYTTQDGLSNNTTYCLLKDSSGNIWVSTNNGISRINPSTDQISTFDLTDGLEIQEFNSGAKFKADDGEFFFGGMGGFVRFYPDSLKEVREPGLDQKIILTNLEVSGGKRILSRPLNETDTIILNKGENNFHLTFSSTDFVNSDKNLFRYKLSGINNEWINTTVLNRNINYSNLKPGWYKLNLEVTDINGNWGSRKNITIRISPYFYQTRIFNILAPLFTIILIFYLILTFIRQIRQKERQKQDELKLQSLRGQMNPHFIFNSLNSINYFISNNDKLSANRYIADFSKLIRSILYNLSNDFITLEKEIESVEDYLKIEYLRFGDKFDYKLIAEEGINQDRIKVSPGMVQPFVENAIWHGVRGLDKRKGNVEVSFTMYNEKLKCTIEDDGIGRKNSEAAKSKIDQKVSKGIFIVTERLKILSKLQKSNYQIIITDLNPEKQETGTRVMIDIPVKKN